jgi:uncharacterized membrane protein YeaQ/YmgE (transglycosylase-associated protein family)
MKRVCTIIGGIAGGVIGWYYAATGTQGWDIVFGALVGAWVARWIVDLGDDD